MTRIRGIVLALVLLLATGTWFGSAWRFWRGQEYAPRATLPGSDLPRRGGGDARPAAAYFSPGLSADGKSYAMLVYPDGWGNPDAPGQWDVKSEVVVYDVATGKERTRIRTDKRIHNVGFSADGKWILGPDAIWDAASGAVWIDAGGRVGETARFSEDGKIVVLGERPPHSPTTTMKFIDLASRRELARVEGCDSFDPAPRVGFSRDGRRAAVPCHGVAVVSLPDGQVTMLKQTASSAALSPDGKLLALRQREEGVRLVDLETLAEKQGPIFLFDEEPRRGQPRAVEGLAFAAGGKYLLAWAAEWGPHRRRLKVWDVAKAKAVLERDIQQPPKLLGDGSVLSLARETLWSLAGDAPRETFGPLPHNLASREGRFLVTLHPTASGRGQGFRVLEATPDGLLGRHSFDDKELDYGIETAGVTPDGKYLVAGGFGGVFLYDVSRRERIGRFPGAGSLFEFAPDGSTLVSWNPSGGPVHVWDIPLAKPFGGWPSHVLAFVVLLLGLPFCFRRSQQQQSNPAPPGDTRLA